MLIDGYFINNSNSNISAFFGAAIFLIATGFIPCTKRELAVVLLCLAVSSPGFNRGAFAVNHIDIGPK